MCLDPKITAGSFRGCQKPFIHRNLKCSKFLSQSESWKQVIGSVVQNCNRNSVTLVAFLHLAVDYVFKHAVIL